MKINRKKVKKFLDIRAALIIIYLYRVSHPEGEIKSHSWETQ